MASRSELISKLQTLRNNKDDNVKRTAGLALAALELNPKADSLKGLIGTSLDNFNVDTGAAALSSSQIQAAVKTWLGSDLITEGSLTVGRNVTKDGKLQGSIDSNLLNQLAISISSCVQGKLSESVCKDFLEVAGGFANTKQMVNLKLAVTTLKSLGFEISEEKSLLVAGSDKLPQFQSVDEWMKDNKSSLPTRKITKDGKEVEEVLLNPKLIQVLETLVLTANAYAQDWEKESLVPAKFSTRKVVDESGEEVPIIIGIMTQLDGFTSYQKYLSGLLPIKAKKLGILDFNLFGGAGLQHVERDDAGKVMGGLYTSYVDEEVDTRKGFFTADTLKTFFDKYMKIFEKKGIKITDSEVTGMEKNIEKLKKDEVDLANVTKIIEQYLALKKYLGVTDTAKTTQEISEILQKHANKLQKVDKRRKGLGNVLYVMAQQIDTILV